METSAFDDDRRLRLLLESISDHAIYMLDPEGRVATWNNGAVQLKGYQTAEIQGEHFSRFFPPESRLEKLPEKLLERARREGRAESEGWRVRKDGSRFWAVSALQAIRSDDGELQGFAKITRDMTAQRAAHVALVESERRFRLLVEGVVDYAIYMLAPDGTISNWNRGAERIKGYTADEAVGRHFGMFYTPEDRQAGMPAKTLKTALTEGRLSAEGWRVRKDGVRFWASVVVDAIYDDDGRHIGFAKITRDMSERRAAEQALIESERQFRMLVSGVVDYALFMLDPNGIVTNWNTGAQQIKGYTAQEIVGQHVSRFYTEVDRAAGRPFFALNEARTKGRFEGEGWRVRKDGSLFWASVVIDAIRDETGEIAGFAKITRDITERRNAQIELQRARDHLAQAQKMEALGQLTGGVAHDFNNLLTIVSGQAQLMRRRLKEEPGAIRALDAIDSAVSRGVELTRHLLSFARRQRLEPAAVSLSERATSLKELLSASLPSSVTLVVDLAKSLWPVQVDISELEIAVLNLAVNARDAMPSGGVLSIFAENASLKPGDRDLDLEGDFVVLTVSDTGVGIPPDILARVFEPFFTTKEVDRGTGLGLSQVFGFVQQTGGRVTVQSELGDGANFTLYLPRAHGEVEVEAGPGETESPFRAARILVVEDNPEVAEVAAALLVQIGHRAQVVSNAAAALEVLEGAEPPDLIFSDIVMAGEMDGVAFARHVRETYPTLPLLLATGYSKTAEQIGDSFPILRKPYHLDDLNRAVSALLAGPPGPGGKLVPFDAARARARRKAKP